MSALLKDILREVNKSFGRFFAIFAIVMIGVAFFAGITAASGDMKYSADRYFDVSNLYDLNILSTSGFTREDLEEIEKTPGVRDIAAYRSVDVLAQVGNSYQVFKMMSIPKDNKADMNQVRLKEGRLPQKSGECVVKYESIRGTEMKLGDTIEFVSGNDTPIEDSLATTKYTIVGFIYTPVYMSYELGNSDIGNGNVSYIAMAPEEDFAFPEEENTMFPELLAVYTGCYVTVENVAQYNSYTDEAYEDAVDAVKSRLEDLGKDICEDKNELLAQLTMGKLQAEWYVLDRNANYSIVAYENSADQMADIAMIFPVFFFFVAALVCLTTMTRMVDEQRGLVGTYKALGYGKLSISLKYVLYALTASLLGGIIGCIVGDIVFPTVIYYSWTIVYQMPDIVFDNHMLLNIVAVLSMTGITTLAAVLACYKELVSQPSQLMRPRTPKMGKKIFLEHIGVVWKRFSFIQKVTARNIFRYKKRFLMTLIGIAGCTALLLAGFGIKNSIQGLIRKQFNEIFQYNATISLEEHLSDGAAAELFKELDKDDAIEKYMPVSVSKASLKGEDKEIEADLYVVGDDSQMSEYIHLRRRPGVNCDWNKEGVVITQKAASDLNLSKGDEIRLKIGDTTKTVQVTDIAEMYVGHYIFAAESYYEELFGKERPLYYDTVLCVIGDTDRDAENAVGSRYMAMEQVDNVAFISGNIERFNDMIESLGLVTLVLIVSAGALAFVVLYNLTNVNISERIREIATIKVLGFYDKEVSAYVYRENIAITVMGAIIGLALGVLLHMFIMDTIAMEDVIFGHEIRWESYLYSFLITMVFACLVNIVMFRKMKKIPMVESLKSVE